MGVLQSVLSGVILAGTLAAVRVVWNRRHVPTALARRVGRKTYLGAVLSASRQDAFNALDVLAPRLTPSAGNPMIAEIQDAWVKINARGRVRVLTLDSRECLEGGLELLSRGIQVRVARRDLDSEDLSYHVFGRPGAAETAIVNHHDAASDRPMRLTGSDPIKVFRKHFEAMWGPASPLEAVIAEKVTEKITEFGHGSRDPAVVMRALAETGLNLAPCIEKVRTHLAFRNSSTVVFVVGLPGAGKSRVRRCLTERLEEMGIQVRELTDYLYAFRDFLHGQIKLEPNRGRFEACAGGAFAVRDERSLRPALQALDQAIRDGLKESEVTIAEFARPDLVGSLDQFDDIRSRCRVIYVQAPAQLRSARLNSRVEPPELSIIDRSVAVTPSDNHRLPSSVEQSLYAVDDFEQLERSPYWRGRILRIDNDVDDGGGRINAKIDEFLTAVVSPYTTPPRDTRGGYFDRQLAADEHSLVG